MKARSNWYRRGAGKSGFTLVELLVVIGIIAVLIAILLPALQEVRKQGAKTKCLAHLREVGRAYYMYAQDFKGAFPMVRQDITRFPFNIYWTDMLAPYISREKNNFNLSTNAAQRAKEFEATRRTVFWGCPSWEGRPQGGAVAIAGISRFDTGYGMQSQPTMQPNYPQSPPATANADVPNTEHAMWWSPRLGKYYTQTQWGKNGSQRIIVADSRLWWLHVSRFGLNNTTKRPIPQPTTLTSQTSFDFDRFRHGKVPPVKPGETTFVDARGKVAFNALYADGHAATITDVLDGWRGIRMKNPQ